VALVAVTLWAAIFTVAPSANTKAPTVNGAPNERALALIVTFGIDPVGPVSVMAAVTVKVPVPVTVAPVRVTCHPTVKFPAAPSPSVFETSTSPVTVTLPVMSKPPMAKLPVLSVTEAPVRLSVPGCTHVVAPVRSTALPATARVASAKTV